MEQIVYNRVLLETKLKPNSNFLFMSSFIHSGIKSCFRCSEQSQLKTTIAQQTRLFFVLVYLSKYCIYLSSLPCFLRATIFSKIRIYFIFMVLFKNAESTRTYLYFGLYYTYCIWSVFMSKRQILFYIMRIDMLIQ